MTALDTEHTIETLMRATLRQQFANRVDRFVAGELFADEIAELFWSAGGLVERIAIGPERNGKLSVVCYDVRACGIYALARDLVLDIVVDVMHDKERQVLAADESAERDVAYNNLEVLAQAVRRLVSSHTDGGTAARLRPLRGLLKRDREDRELMVREVILRLGLTDNEADLRYSVAPSHRSFQRARIENKKRRIGELVQCRVEKRRRRLSFGVAEQEK